MGNGFVTVDGSCHPHLPSEPPVLPNRFCILCLKDFLACQCGKVCVVLDNRRRAGLRVGRSISTVPDPPGPRDPEQFINAPTGVLLWAVIRIAATTTRRSTRTSELPNLPPCAKHH